MSFVPFTPDEQVVIEGEIVFGHTRRRRKGTASLAFIPQHLFMLNSAYSELGIVRLDS